MAIGKHSKITSDIFTKNASDRASTEGLCTLIAAELRDNSIQPLLNSYVTVRTDSGNVIGELVAYETLQSATVVLIIKVHDVYAIVRNWYAIICNNLIHTKETLRLQYISPEHMGSIRLKKR